MEQEKSELNKRIEEEQISNSRNRENLEEEWKTKLEKEKRKHDVESEQLKEEVRSGNRIRERLEQEIERKEEYLERSEEYNKKMDEMRREASKRGEEAREELWEKNFGVTETPKQRDGITKRAEDVERGKEENGE